VTATADGTKVPLAVVEGTTENKAVCTRLVVGLRDRGLDTDRGVLFVIDGGKALAAAVRGSSAPRRSFSGAAGTEAGRK
jgi:hypothetical protein